MSNEADLSIVDIIDSPFCVASDDGQKVYEQIAGCLRRGGRVRLSFEGVEDLTSAFLNAAVGQLYNGDFSADYIRAHVEPTHASPEDLLLLKRVVERAKGFFRNPEPYYRAAAEALGEDDV